MQISARSFAPAFITGALLIVVPGCANQGDVIGSYSGKATSSGPLETADILIVRYGNNFDVLPIA